MTMGMAMIAMVMSVVIVGVSVGVLHESIRLARMVARAN
jgi:hypothetical protein